MPTNKEEWGKIVKVENETKHLKESIEKMEKRIEKLEDKIKDLRKEKTEGRRYIVTMLLAIGALLISIVSKALDFLS